MFGRIKIRQSDKYYSKYLRKKMKYQCEVCGRVHEENSMNLGVSHFNGRANEATRFFDPNCDVLCNIPCHRYFEEHKTEYETWKKKKLGERGFKLLLIQSNTYKKRDDKMDTLIAKELLKSLN